MKATQITTYWQNHEAKRLIKELNIRQDDDSVELEVLNVYPEAVYQTIQGFGGAVTDAVASVLEKAPEEVQKDFFKRYFSQEGIGYSLLRVPMDSCDFSETMYEATDGEKLILAPQAQRIHRLITEIGTFRGESCKIFLSPWSPPARMKDNASRIGGHLQDGSQKEWADYICRYILVCREEGIDVTMFSVQNEPNAWQTWDSCLYTPQQEREFLMEYLVPSLERYGLKDLQIFIWDHNKERLVDRALSEIDVESNRVISGLAFHWYSGDHFDALRIVRDLFPEKKLIFTEGCVEYSRFGDNSQLQSAQMYAHDYIGNLRAGANAMIDWNILLDIQGGPNHVQNYCSAPIIYDEEKQQLIQNLTFDYIGHFSRYITPGAHCIGSTVYSSAVEHVAVENQDGSIAVVCCNRTERDLPVHLRLEGQIIDFCLEKNTISTIVIQER